MTVINKLGEEIKYEDKSDYLTWWKLPAKELEKILDAMMKSK